MRDYDRFPKAEPGVGGAGTALTIEEVMAAVYRLLRKHPEIQAEAEEIFNALINKTGRDGRGP